jgi:hypothetical protein
MKGKELLKLSKRKIAAFQTSNAVMRIATDFLKTHDIVELKCRCKDCKHRYTLCFERVLDDNDFCSKGEPKEIKEDK